MDVRIRPLEENDAKVSYAWRNNPNIWKYTGSSPNREITVEDELSWIRKVIQDDTCRRFAILADHVYVGNIYLTDIHDREAEYHIFIGNEEYMGKGIAKEASKLIIEYARNNLKLNSIHLEVRPDNVRAVQLYLSLGFYVAKEDTEFIEMSINL